MPASSPEALARRRTYSQQYLKDYMPDYRARLREAKLLSPSARRGVFKVYEMEWQARLRQFEERIAALEMGLDALARHNCYSANQSQIKTPQPNLVNDGSTPSSGPAVVTKRKVRQAKKG